MKLLMKLLGGIFSAVATIKEIKLINFDKGNWYDEILLNKLSTTLYGIIFIIGIFLLIIDFNDWRKKKKSEKLYIKNTFWFAEPATKEEIATINRLDKKIKKQK